VNTIFHELLEQWDCDHVERRNFDPSSYFAGRFWRKRIVTVTVCPSVYLSGRHIHRDSTGAAYDFVHFGPPTRKTGRLVFSASVNMRRCYTVLMVNWTSSIK